MVDLVVTAECCVLCNMFSHTIFLGWPCAELQRREDSVVHSSSHLPSPSPSSLFHPPRRSQRCASRNHVARTPSRASSKCLRSSTVESTTSRSPRRSCRSWESTQCIVRVFSAPWSSRYCAGCPNRCNWEWIWSILCKYQGAVELLCTLTGEHLFYVYPTQLTYLVNPVSCR